MRAQEATDRAAKEKARCLPNLLTRSTKSKVALLKKATESPGMGSLAKAQVMSLLGGQYGKSGMLDLLNSATEKQLNNTLDYAYHYVARTMKTRPEDTRRARQRNEWIQIAERLHEIAELMGSQLEILAKNNREASGALEKISKFAHEALKFKVK